MIDKQFEKEEFKKSVKEKANDAPDWAKRQRYDPNKSADRNARMCLIRNMGRGTIRLDQTQNIAKLKSGYSATKAISDGVI